MVQYKRVNVENVVQCKRDTAAKKLFGGGVGTMIQKCYQISI